MCMTLTTKVYGNCKISHSSRHCLYVDSFCLNSFHVVFHYSYPYLHSCIVVTMLSVQIRESTLKAVEEELRALKSRNDDRVDKYACLIHPL